MNIPRSAPPNILRAPAPAGEGDLVTRIFRESTPTLIGYVKILLARRWLFAGVCLLLLVPAVLLIWKMTPVYVATATMFVEAPRGRVASIEEVYGGVGSATREHYQTQAEILQSRDIALRVTRDLRLTEHEAFDPRQAQPGLKAALLKFLGQDEDSDGEREWTQARLETVVSSLIMADLNVRMVRNSQLIEISFESPDAKLAATIANAIGDAYIKSDLDARLRTTQTASSWLNDQMGSLRSKLDESERRLQKFREDSGIVASRGSAEGGNARQLEEIAQRLVQARVSRAQLEQVYQQLRPGAAGRFEAPVVFNNPAVARAREAMVAAERKLAELRERLGPAHPLFKSALNELEAARADHRAQAEAVIASIAKEYEVARGTERMLEDSINRARGALQDINRKGIGLEALEREVAINRQLYETFLTRLKEAAASGDFRSPVARMVDPATEPIMAGKPPKRLLAVVSALIAALLSAGLVIALDQSRTGIRTTDDVEVRLATNLLSAVPALPAGSIPGSRSGRGKPDPIYAESIRTALTGVQLALGDVRNPVIVFSSSLPGEGKSTLSLNYALELARTRRVLLIDADLRRPSIGKMIGLPANNPGIQSLLSGKEPGECIVQIKDSNLCVMAGGEAVTTALDLFLTPRLEESLSRLRQRFDAIIIDTPPVELVSDALLIGRHADGVVIVVKADSTPQKVAHRTLERLRAANLRVLGVILNEHDFKRAARYYGDTAVGGKYPYA